MGPAVYDTQIPRSVRLSEAPSHGLPIALYEPESKGAKAYSAFSREFRERLRAAEPPATSNDRARRDPVPVMAGRPVLNSVQNQAGVR